MKFFPSLLLAFFAFAAIAEKMDVKLKDVSADNDTSITIGKNQGQCVEYEIVSGQEEISVAPEYDKTKARKEWQLACDEWKKSMRELNKENRIITLNCGSPTRSTEGDQHAMKSTATYKVRVQMKERR